VSELSGCVQGAGTSDAPRLDPLGPSL